MAKLTLYNREGEKVKDIKVPDNIFAAPEKRGALYQTAVAQASRRRLGTASSKGRSDVRGGGAKPWPQKGTGRARHGTTRSPLWVGGGVTFGPHLRSFSKDVPKKMRRAALKSALSGKFNDGSIVVVDDFSLEKPQTRKVAELLKKLNVNGGALIVAAEVDVNLVKSARNLPKVKTILARQLNVLDVLSHHYLVMDRAALQQVEEVFGG